MFLKHLLFLLFWWICTYLHGEKYTKYQLSSNWNEFSTKMSRFFQDSKLKLSLSAPLEILTKYESTKFKTKNCPYSNYLAFPQRMYVHCTSNLSILILIRIWIIIVLKTSAFFPRIMQSVLLFFPQTLF